MTISNKENLTQAGEIQDLPVAAATEISIGELMTYNESTHKVEPFDAVADSTKFCGVAGSASAVDETDDVKTYKKGVFEFDVASGDYHADDEFRWGAAKRTVALSTSNQIGRCFEETGASATKVLLKIDAYIAY